MRSFLPRRTAALALLVLVALTSAGCPELNRQPSRPSDPLFSIDDPAGRTAQSPNAAKPAARSDRGQSVISVQGGLSDQARQAQ